MPTSNTIHILFLCLFFPFYAQYLCKLFLRSPLWFYSKNSTGLLLWVWLSSSSAKSRKAQYLTLTSSQISTRNRHIHRSLCFCINSASLYLLVGTFNPFTFKVIIDKYDPITIYFGVLGLSLYILSVSPV